ncbi:hypothetical protein EC957_001983 [Mortierella hygrophila]|uniref:Uncharacterized protein n=1 Tax=Mortierella hygrophila TaxID=979708 RepID=A0A9P6F545_9FUNG|nr:hypothetical protein EC957_001983 [Mortierella hygrophila]
MDPQPEDPLTWDPLQVTRWLKSAFNFPDDILKLFIEHDVDGQILLSDLDHEALKNEFNIASFGKRCMILKHIQTLRGQANRTVDSPSGALEHDLESLRLSELVATAPAPEYTTTTARPVTTPLAEIDNTRLSERRFRDSAPEFKKIRMLAKPLRLLFDNELNIHQRSPSSRKKRNTRNRKSIRHSDEDSLSIGSSDDFDEDDSDHDNESDVDSNSNSSGYDDAANQDFDSQKHQSQDEEDKPLATRLLERKEYEPLATRILKQKENESLAQRLQQLKNLDQGKDSPSLAHPNPIKPLSQSGGSRSGPEPKGGSESKSGSGSKIASGTTTTKIRITPTLVKPGVASSPPSTTRHPSTLLSPKIHTGSPSETTTKQSKATSKKARRIESKLAKIGMTLQDVFFNKDGSAFDSDDDDNWTVVRPRATRKKELSTYQKAVQINMRRILRIPPIFEAPGHVVYAPMRKPTHKDVPVRVISTALSRKNTTVRSSTWDAIFKDVHKDVYKDVHKNTTPQRLMINIGDHDLTSINFAALTKGPSHTPPSVNWATDKDDDIVYPLYGDSDASEYTTDEELYKEVAKEEKELQEKLSGCVKVPASNVKLSTDVIKEIARIYISDRKEAWTRLERPKLGRAARKLGKTLGNKEDRQLYIERLKATIEALSQRRLASLLEAMEKTSYRTATEVRKACKALDETVDSMCHEQWKHDILCGTEPIPDDVQNSDTETKSSLIGPKVWQEPKRDHPSAKSSGETDSAIETDEEAEERRQRELDAAFIDDFDYDEGGHADIDNDESEKDAGGDVSMVGTPQRPSKMPSTTSQHLTLSKPATPIFRSVSATPNARSLPTPPFTATSPQYPPPFSDLDIAGDDAKHPSDNDDDDGDVQGDYTNRKAPLATRKESKKAKKRRLAKNKAQEANRASSPIYIDLDDDYLKQPGRSISPSKKAAKFKSTHSRQPPNAPQPSVKRESSPDEDLDGKAQKKPNPTGSASPLETDRIPKSLVTVSSRDDDEDTSVVAVPQPATNVKPMKRPKWREELKSSGMADNNLLAKLRETSKNARLGINVVMEEPYISAWQEYIEWVELDGGDSIELKEFLAWKDEGNTTQIYREKAREVAQAQAVTDRAAALNAKEKQTQDEQDEQEARDKKAKEKNGEKSATDIEERSTMSEGSSQRLKGGKGKSTTKRPSFTSHPETITIESSDDTDSSQKRLSVASRRSTTKPRTESSSSTSSSPVPKRPTRKELRDLTESDTASESATDKEDLDAEARRLEMNLKKRPRAARNHFGDGSPEVSSGDDRMFRAQPRPIPKRRKAVAEDEAQDVRILRLNAAKNEEEYQKRIKDQEQRAKIRGAPNPLLGDEVLINPGHKKTERAVIIPSFLTVNLKPHQIDGLRFIWKNIIMFDGGCILAHSMGLGKTFQVVAFIYVLLTEIHSGNKDIPAKLQNWADEFEKWIPPQRRKDVLLYKFAPNNTSTKERIRLLEKWHADGGVFLMGYTMFRELSVTTKSNAARNEDTSNRFKHLLLTPGPSLVFADEGHAIKNKNAKLSMAAKEIKSTARVILTGYPLQNRLEEYWCMVDFVRPKFLDDIAIFRSHYIRPISNGLHSDSSELERKISSKKLKVLTELIKNFVMRKDQSILRASLPKKYEFVISCKLSTLQYYLYTQILPTFPTSGSANVLGNGQLLLTICNHPAAFKASTKDISAKSAGTSVKASPAESGSPSTTLSTLNGTITVLDDSDEEPGEKEKEMAEALSQNKALARGSWLAEINQKNITDVSHGFKVKIAIDIIRESRAINEKVLVFSRSIPTLDFLAYTTEQAGFKSMMLDGSTPIQDRQGMINDFNRNDYDLFLISSGAGSQGVNLVSASRVIIFDVGWNPSHDEQAIARAFRYGQTRKVFVYRLHTFGTWEDKLYKTNLHKLGLSNRVVDKKNIFQAHSKTEMNMYFEPPPVPASNPQWVTEENVSALFDKVDSDDSVLRSIMQTNKEQITHIVPQSELVREVDSDLTEADMIDIKSMIEEEERRIKWAEENPGVPCPPLPPMQAAVMGLVSTPVVTGPPIRPTVPHSAILPPGSTYAPGPTMGAFPTAQLKGGYQPQQPNIYRSHQTVPRGHQSTLMSMMPQVASSSATPAQGSSQRTTITMPISSLPVGRAPASTSPAGLSARTAIDLSGVAEFPVYHSSNNLADAGRPGLGIQTPFTSNRPYEYGVSGETNLWSNGISGLPQGHNAGGGSVRPSFGSGGISGTIANTTIPLTTTTASNVTPQPPQVGGTTTASPALPAPSRQELAPVPVSAPGPELGSFQSAIQYHNSQLNPLN